MNRLLSITSSCNNLIFYPVFFFFLLISLNYFFRSLSINHSCAHQATMNIFFNFCFSDLSSMLRKLRCKLKPIHQVICIFFLWDIYRAADLEILRGLKAHTSTRNGIVNSCSSASIKTFAFIIQFDLFLFSALSRSVS